MPKRSSNPDLNQIAAPIVEQSTGDDSGRNVNTTKNPAAVALGRLGGLKGGKARAKKLSATKRRDIARKAALRRWRRKG
jgi:hypothetical protein